MATEILIMNDMHIAPRGELYHGKNPGKIFRQCLNTLCSERRPDLLLLNGDLCAHEPSPEVYMEIAELCRQAELPLLAFPGNHDDTSIMAQNLPLPSQTLSEMKAVDIMENPNDPYCGWCRLNSYGLLWLNTSSHKLEDNQIAWFKQHQDSFHAEKGIIVFIHHPPAHVPSRFMEQRYPLINREEAWELISGLPNLQRIFCGHYHRTWDDPNIPLTMISSSLYSIDPETEKHNIAHYNPGYGRLSLKDKMEYMVAELPENMIQN